MSIAPQTITTQYIKNQIIKYLEKNTDDVILIKDLYKNIEQISETNFNKYVTSHNDHFVKSIMKINCVHHGITVNGDICVVNTNKSNEEIENKLHIKICPITIFTDNQDNYDHDNVSALLYKHTIENIIHDYNLQKLYNQAIVDNNIPVKKQKKQKTNSDYNYDDYDRILTYTCIGINSVTLGVLGGILFTIWC